MNPSTVTASEARSTRDLANMRARIASGKRNQALFAALGVLFAGLAQVHVQIDQTGRHDAPTGVEGDRIVGQSRTRIDHVSQRPVLDAQIGFATTIIGGGRVDDSTTANDEPSTAHVRAHEGTAAPGAANRSNNTAMRTDIPLVT